MRLHFIRHPQPEVPAGVCYGRSDLALKAAPGPEARRLNALLPSDYILYSSPLSRASSLASLLGTPRIDARLQEMDFGRWELQPYEELSQEVRAWAQDPLGYRIPGGETGREVAARIWSFHQELADQHRDADIVVVGHSGPFRLWITQALGLPLEQHHVFQLDFAKLTTIEILPFGGRLIAMNL